MCDDIGSLGCLFWVSMNSDCMMNESSLNITGSKSCEITNGILTTVRESSDAINECYSTKSKQLELLKSNSIGRQIYASSIGTAVSVCLLNPVSVVKIMMQKSSHQVIYR